MHLSFGGRFLAEDSDCKLFVVQAAALILIVGVEKWAQLIFREVHASFFQHALELGEVYSSLVHNVKVLEHLHKASLFRHLGSRLLNQLVFQLFLKTADRGD